MWEGTRETRETRRMIEELLRTFQAATVSSKPKETSSGITTAELRVLSTPSRTEEVWEQSVMITGEQISRVRARSSSGNPVERQNSASAERLVAQQEAQKRQTSRQGDRPDSEKLEEESNNIPKSNDKGKRPEVPRERSLLTIKEEEVDDREGGLPDDPDSRGIKTESDSQGEPTPKKKKRTSKTPSIVDVSSDNDKEKRIR